MAKTQINLKIEQERKDEWEQFAEEQPDMASLTALIRRAVSEYIQTDDENGEPAEVEQLLVNQFEQVQSRLDSIENSTKAIQLDQLTQDQVQQATLLGVEEFWEAEGVDLSKLPNSDREEWRQG
jgi:translation initiation factor 2B subunit (eIF-2B alpha/beta/delta family)